MMWQLHSARMGLVFLSTDTIYCLFVLHTGILFFNVLHTVEVEKIDAVIGPLYSQCVRVVF